jgi:hypothetical protein
MGKHTQIKLIRDFFEAKMDEMKALTPNDRNELASGIARFRGISEADCNFTFCIY